MFELLVAEIKGLDEGIWLLRAAVPRKSVQDFRQLCLPDDRVLDLSDVFIGQDDVALVNAKLKRQEVDVESGRLPFANFDLFVLQSERLRNEQVLGRLLNRSLIFGALLPGLFCLGVLLGLV